MAILSTDIVLVCGQRGSGKSTLLAYLLSKFRRYIIYDTNFEHDRLGKITSNLKELKKMFATENRIVFQPRTDDVEFFSEFCDEVWKFDNFMLAVEETSRYASNTFMPPRFWDIVRIGRHKGIGLIAVTQRIAELNKNIASNSSHIFVFYHYLPQDLKYLREVMVRVADKIPRLSAHSFIYFSRGELQGIGKLKI